MIPQIYNLIKLEKNLKEVGGYKLKINKATKRIIVKEGFEDSCGARQLNRTLEKLVEDPISSLILKGELSKGATIHVKVKGEKLEITPSDKI